MKGEWIWFFNEDGTPTKEFVRVETAVNAATGQVFKYKGNVIIPLEVWENLAFDNEQIDAIDVEWKKPEPTTAAREEKEYGEIYNWLLSRFERKE